MISTFLVHFVKCGSLHVFSRISRTMAANPKVIPWRKPIPLFVNGCRCRLCDRPVLQWQKIQCKEAQCLPGFKHMLVDLKICQMQNRSLLLNAILFCKARSLSCFMAKRRTGSVCTIIEVNIQRSFSCSHTSSVENKLVISYIGFAIDTKTLWTDIFLCTETSAILNVRMGFGAIIIGLFKLTFHIESLFSLYL